MAELPELYWSAEHGLIYRTENGRLAQSLRHRYLDGELPADAVQLVPGRAAAELPRIPGSFTRFDRDKIAFVTYDDQWHLFGPARMLPVGEEVWVDRFADNTNQLVRVGPHVAERAVRHQGSRRATHYVIAQIDRGGKK